MAVAERPGREKPLKIEQRKVRGPRTRVRTSGKTNSTPGWPNLHRTGPGREKHIKRGAKALFSLFLPHPGVLSSSRLRVDMPSRLEDGFSCYLLNKIELQH